MRASRTSDGLTVRAIAGSHVVMLGMSMPREDCDGHMGFAIHRTDYTGEEARWMSGIKTFEETDPGFVAGSTYSTREHPVQGFTWSDYSAKPGRRYKYRVLALKGTPRNLQPFREVAVFVTTESEVGGDNDVFFNRGAAASQEYARRFGNRQPDEGNPGDGRWAWLSRCRSPRRLRCRRSGRAPPAGRARRGKGGERACLEGYPTRWLPDPMVTRRATSACGGAGSRTG